ncbi:MAG: LegC family aminotransferase [Chthoniobacter sp.]|uniref:LegC family aminotransferase n=1 Tax=Chthoniobacter sp. TaxID=2510640 RepID=UPI0032ADCF28
MRSEPGAPVEAGFVPLCIPEIRGNEWTYVKECLDTGWVSSVGSYVDRFERMVADYVGAKYAVATVNGTAALHIALLVAGVQPEDEVLVSALTFIASANAIRYAGAWPVFIDAEPEYWQFDVQKATAFLEQGCRVQDGALRNSTTGRRVKAILAVDILGHPADRDAIRALARRFELEVIEDATESLGADYRGKKVGSGSAAACFSFNGNKILTTGGGGMIVTDNEEWMTKARYLTTQAKDDPLEYIHGEIGYNYRLTNVQAAIGCAQMEQLNDYVAAKRRIAARYVEAFRDVPGLAPMPEAAWARNTFWMFTTLVEPPFALSSRGLLCHLQTHKIQARPLWQPLHLSPAHQPAPGLCPVAESLYARALSLPCSVGLRPEDQERVITTILTAGKTNS